MSRISPWLLGVLFLGLAVGAMVMPLSSDIVPYAFLFDRNEVKNDQQRFLYTVVEDSGIQKDELQPLLPKLRPLEKQLPVALYIAKESGKPAEIAAKMVEGAVNKFLGEITLMGQPFVKDDKQTVEKMLAAKKGKVNGYAFLVVGEGIEKASPVH